MPDEVGHQRGLLGDAVQCAQVSASCRVSISSDRQLLRMLPRRQVSAGDSARKSAIGAHCADGTAVETLPSSSWATTRNNSAPTNSESPAIGNTTASSVGVMMCSPCLGYRKLRRAIACSTPDAPAAGIARRSPRRVRRAGQPRHQGFRCERAAECGVDEHGQALVSPIGLGAQCAAPG